MSLFQSLEEKRVLMKELVPESQSGHILRAVERIQRPGGKANDERTAMPPTCERSKQKIFHVLEITYGKLLLVYFMRCPEFEALGAKRSLGL